MKKIDLKKDLKQYFQASSKDAAAVDVPKFRFLMIDGKGDPNKSAEYQQAVEALFSVSYTAKFMVKKGPQQIDYGVMPLEGLWWADDMSSFLEGAKDLWKWTMMILQPDFVSGKIIESAREEARKKKALSTIDRLREEEFTEGRSAQILHVGPFSEERPTILRLHEFIDARGAKRTGKHHEIYLTDIRRAEPAKWKTILRQPMK
ncbi:MAG: GyrI-like domain-containing protein [Candidatus Aminicenantales bacterium]